MSTGQAPAETGLWTGQEPSARPAPYPLLFAGAQPDDILVCQGTTGGHRAAVRGASPSFRVWLGRAAVLLWGHRGRSGLGAGCRHGAPREVAQGPLGSLKAHLALPQLLLQGPVQAIAHRREVRTAGRHLFPHQVLTPRPQVRPSKSTGHAVRAPAKGVEEHTAWAQIRWFGLQVALHIMQETAAVSKRTRSHQLLCRTGRDR